jgi:hypothetical protein
VQREKKNLNLSGTRKKWSFVSSSSELKTDCQLLSYPLYKIKGESSLHSFSLVKKNVGLIDYFTIIAI